MLVGETGAWLLPMGTGISCESSHLPHGGFKLFSEVYGNASLAFLHLPTRGSWVGLGKHQTSKGPVKGAVGDVGKLLCSTPKAFGRSVIPEASTLQVWNSPKMLWKTSGAPDKLYRGTEPEMSPGPHSATRHTPGFIVEVILLQLAGLFVELAAVQSK